MKKQAYAVFLLLFVTVIGVGTVQARSFDFNNGLNGVMLQKGQYDLTVDLKGDVWQEGSGHGWYPSDAIKFSAYLNGDKVSSYTVSGLNGQKQTFDRPWSFSVNAKDNSQLLFTVSKQTGADAEVFSMTSSRIKGDFQPPSTPDGPPVVSGATGGQVHNVPEPSSMILLMTGFAVLALGRKHLRRTL